jgi:hypothetical protein
VSDWSGLVEATLKASGEDEVGERGVSASDYDIKIMIFLKYSLTKGGEPW